MLAYEIFLKLIEDCHQDLKMFQAQDPFAIIPPSTFTKVPVINEALSLARKATTFAMSSGAPNRPIG